MRPATSADYAAFYGRMPELTTRAMVVIKDGEIACIAGVSIGKTFIEAFSDMKPGVQAPKRTIWRYARLLRDFIASLRLPVIALCDPGKPLSGKFLESLGFVCAGEFNNYKAYRLTQWQQQRH